MKYFVMIAAILVSGCAPTVFQMRPEALASPGSVFGSDATIYVLRDDTFAQSAWPLSVRLDKVEQGSLRRKQYLRFSAREGTHEVIGAYPGASMISPIAIVGAFQGGHTYYFMYKTSNDSQTESWGFEQLSSAVAQGKLQSYESKSPKVGEAKTSAPVDTR
jgi:hypothetical protein